jgi:hypothetical protein
MSQVAAAEGVGRDRRHNQHDMMNGIKVMLAMWLSSKEYRELIGRLDAISRQLFLIRQGEKAMATKADLDALNEQVQANSDATQAAAAALQGYVKTVADLTAQLQQAVAADDTAAIQAATQALQANNAVLQAAVPQTAAAVTANTPAAGQ